jgi:hypothetical protein
MKQLEKAAILVEKGKYKQALRLMNKVIKSDPENQHLYRLRFEYGQFIPFDNLYHHASEEFFRLLLNKNVSGHILHDHYSIYLSTTQGRINLTPELLLEMAAIFAGYEYENDAVYLTNKFIRSNIKPPQIVDAIVSLVNFYVDKGQKSKSQQYIHYMQNFFADHPMTKYIQMVYSQAEK